jgi:hypothetical protein
MFSFQSEIVPIEDDDYQDALAFVLEKLSKSNLMLPYHPSTRE